MQLGIPFFFHFHVAEQEVEDCGLAVLVLALGGDFAEGVVDLGSARVYQGVSVLSREVELLEEGSPYHLCIEHRLRLVLPQWRHYLDC